MTAMPEGSLKPASSFREVKALFLCVLLWPAQPGFLPLAIKSSDSSRAGRSLGAGNPSIGCCPAFHHCKAKEFRAKTAIPTTTAGEKPTWTSPSHRDRMNCVILMNVGTSLTQQTGASTITTTSTVTAVTVAWSQRCGREAKLPLTVHTKSNLASVLQPRDKRPASGEGSVVATSAGPCSRIPFVPACHKAQQTLVVRCSKANSIPALSGFPREASKRTRPAAGQVEASAACLSSKSTTGNFQIALWLCTAQGGEKSDVPTAFLTFFV